VDSYLKELVHVRPFLFSRYEAALLALAERWLEDGGENALAAVTQQWLARYLAEVPDAQVVTSARDDFYRWAIHADLLDQDPLAAAS
jgi:hypothetical protein